MPQARRPALAGLALVLTFLIPGCQSPTLVVLEDPRTYVEERSLADAREDARIRLDIESLFAEQGTGVLSNVVVEVYEQDVLMVGTVTNRTSRELAGTLASQVEGVGPIQNEIQVVGDSSLEATAADLAIETKIKRSLRAAEGVHSVNMRWHSVNGVVYIFGRALSEDERRKAVAIARDVEGVRDVADFLKVVPLDS